MKIQFQQSKIVVILILTVNLKEMFHVNQSIHEYNSEYGSKTVLVICVQ